MNTLIVLSYPDLDAARRALAELGTLRDRHVVTPCDLACKFEQRVAAPDGHRRRRRGCGRRRGCRGRLEGWRVRRCCGARCGLCPLEWRTARGIGLRNVGRRRRRRLRREHAAIDDEIEFAQHSTAPPIGDHEHGQKRIGNLRARSKLQHRSTVATTPGGDPGRFEVRRSRDAVKIGRAHV